MNKKYINPMCIPLFGSNSIKWNKIVPKQYVYCVTRRTKKTNNYALGWKMLIRDREKKLSNIVYYTVNIHTMSTVEIQSSLKVNECQIQ